MKVSIDLTSRTGKMWTLDMEYFRLPTEYASEIAAVARSYKEFIQGIAGQASQGDRHYGVTFKYEANEEELEGLSERHREVYKGTSTARSLTYSQAVQVQDAGIKLLEQLQAGAHREIASGQRK